MLNRSWLLLGLVLAAACSSACSSSSGSREPRVTVIKPEDRAPTTSGVPPDKEAEVQLLLKQREPSARKCYQDVLNEKHDRAFQGTVELLITIQPSGRASEVRAVGGSLADQAVRECLVATLKEFEYPQLGQAGDVQYTYAFRPAY